MESRQSYHITVEKTDEATYNPFRQNITLKISEIILVVAYAYRAQN